MALDPSLVEVLEAWLYERHNDLHVAMPGKVKSYDANKQTADIIPVIKGSFLKADGSRTEREFPVIPNVRVMWPRAGGCYLHFPMAADDYVQLVFNEASIAQWRESGAVSPPGDLTRHDLSYPYAYPGGWPDSGAFGTAGPAIVVDGVLTVCSEGGTAGAQLVVGATKADTELATLNGMLSTFATAVATWADTAVAAGGGAAGAAALASAAGAMKTAAVNLGTALGLWPSATVGMTKLKAE